MAEPKKGESKIKIPGSVIFFIAVAVFGLIFFTSRRLIKHETENVTIDANSQNSQTDINLSGNHDQNVNQPSVITNQNSNTNTNKNENINSRP